jgi:hypothetical protein
MTRLDEERTAHHSKLGICLRIGLQPSGGSQKARPSALAVLVFTVNNYKIGLMRIKHPPDVSSIRAVSPLALPSFAR